MPSLTTCQKNAATSCTLQRFRLMCSDGQQVAVPESTPRTAPYQASISYGADCTSPSPGTMVCAGCNGRSHVMHPMASTLGLH